MKIVLAGVVATLALGSAPAFANGPYSRDNKPTSHPPVVLELTPPQNGGEAEHRAGYTNVFSLFALQPADTVGTGARHSTQTSVGSTGSG